MGSEETKKHPKTHLQLNPNWAQLQLKVKSNGLNKSSKHTKNPESETHNSILGNYNPACLVTFDAFTGKRKERLEAESDGSKPSPLTPINDDFSLTDVVAMDCEMVGISQGNKSALGRVSLVNKWGNLIYDEFVRPVERVVDFRTRISGIRPRDLRKAKDFPTVQKKVAELIEGRILVGHALHNDLKVLLIKFFFLLVVWSINTRNGRSKALRHLAAEILAVEIQNGEHCPIDDARAAMLLYMKNRKQWEKSVKDQTRLEQKQKKRKPKKKPKLKDAAIVKAAVTAS
ncbi:RNA exonuclease 4 [Citrus sinensis]|uniref:RNA exonuclease 4 n=1 Tax=Citrus sinensis TaxID=2711 RepID=A0ACB8NWI7_CITSI|nr:RNA exonuclease 4 [Citrus sinensis]